MMIEAMIYEAAKRIGGPFTKNDLVRQIRFCHRDVVESSIMPSDHCIGHAVKGAEHKKKFLRLLNKSKPYRYELAYGSDMSMEAATLSTTRPTAPPVAANFIDDGIDYQKFYNLEGYLFGEVRERFRSSGVIEPVDLFMIFIWKSNRAKTKVRDRLKKFAGDFSTAAKRIAKVLSAESDNEKRLHFLLLECGLRLPMATAILTVLFPEEFTVYDIRVCGELGIADFSSLSREKIWPKYQEYIAAVRAVAPPHFSLRDADRFLFGRSVRKDAVKDCAK
jgi:hypothetical protein